MKLLILFTTLIITACAGMPGDVHTVESKVDGSSQVSVTPGWLPDSMIKLGAYADSSKKDDVILVVETKIDTIQSKNGLQINIDGEKTILSSIDLISDIDQGFFSKRFILKKDYLAKMVNGKSVWIRVNGNGKDAAEGEFSRDGMSTARPGFKKLLEQLK